jgi:cation diffusion facilitator family transporter
MNSANGSLNNSAQKAAMTLSLSAGVLLCFVKGYALWLTDSSAVLSDAAESVVHLIALAFAAYSLRISSKPADDDHNYGHGKVAFFSAGFEGAVILGTAILVFWIAIKTLIYGGRVEVSILGQILVGAAGLINGCLGMWLIRQGKKAKSLILEANGRHLLTDGWTSGAALLALLLIQFTGQNWWDPILAILITIHLIVSGAKLISVSVSGLMDEVEPEIKQKFEKILDEECALFSMSWHHLRIRPNGNGYFVDLHLLFTQGTSLRKAHNDETHFELAFVKRTEGRADVHTHLEPVEDHDEYGHSEEFSRNHLDSN